MVDSGRKAELSTWFTATESSLNQLSFKAPQHDALKGGIAKQFISLCRLAALPIECRELNAGRIEKGLALHDDQPVLTASIRHDVQFPTR